MWGFKSYRKGVIRMKKFTAHLLGLVHLPQSKEFLSCAFTQKNRKLAKMLTSLGHTVYFYGSEGSDVEEYCKDEPGELIFVQTHTLNDIRREWGDGDNRFLISYDHIYGEYRHDFNTTRTATYHKFVNACIENINKVKKPDHFLLVTQGVYHQNIDAAVNLYLTLETGIGYRGSYCRWKAFESAFVENFFYGSQHPGDCIDGNFYDRVIPNYFDKNEFDYSEEKDDYYLYIGRAIKRKGVEIAYLATKALGAKLIIAGQAGTIGADGSLQGDAFVIPHDSDWEYLGSVGIERRKTLMSRAKAIFVPTQYLEPFAGTHVEAMLSGTAPITTNFSVFGGDTFVDGVHGFKCNTLDDFIFGARNAHKLDTKVIRKQGERFLMENVRWEYQRWMEDCYQVFLSCDGITPGWAKIRGECPEWRKTTYPHLF